MIFIIYGLLYDTVINTWKPFASKYLQRLGEGGPNDAFYITLYNSLPALVAVMVLLPCTLFISRFKNTKRITTVFFLISRSLLLMLALVPLLPANMRQMAFVSLVALMNFPDAVSQTALQGVLGDVFDGRVRTQAISLRNKFGNVVVPVVTIISGSIINYVPKSDAQRIFIYQVFFAAAFLIGLAEIIVFTRFHTPDKQITGTSEKAASFRQLGVIVKDKRFMNFMVTTIIFQFFWQAGWPLCTILQIQTLGATEIWLALISVASGIGSFFTAMFWNRLSTKRGINFSFFVASVAIAFNLLLMLVCPNILLMVIVSLFSGFASLGVSIGLLNGLLANTPEKNRLVYIAAYNTFANITLFISPFFGLLLMSFINVRFSLLAVMFTRFLAAGVIYLRLVRPEKAAV